ncbi:hypothetical protein VitviT2T_018787 [Vitis vinifera]|uniref:Bromo domain-containing protein n=2 Tax=Vitis vinifera TaxID=29760 RepID=A0ABY9D0I8_VITVI|nr:bromodomain-containing factor 1 [Vitis vinifera]XP_010657989.1 bromodomain-containing factor 1 [Vitis vinifera]WKA00433.1 hypothetical protein VitviT2T_018787 [Vitis vinifera]|eukprot:XP_010657988.1 PREDICTED: bromodomain-containing factor 1 [Vitis vinifera]
MKRKRGHKKGKAKRPPVMGANDTFQNAVSLNIEDNSGLDDYDNAEFDSGMEVDTPSSTGTDQPDKVAYINPGGLIDKPVEKSGYGRVKVKLKTSKMLGSQLTSSTQSDTDKSSQQVGSEKQGIVSEKMEDSANSVPGVKIAVSGNPSKKAGSIKIKSSRGLGSSVSQTSNAVPMHGERSHQKEPKLPHRGPRYDKEELKAALVVIKKVMKMDAAEPFNVPVNPVELGIPDYFDVIDTPMDFGTIYDNLEKGVKYMNSEDVFKDVQYIWENCHKYNNKGDYILELMKRVKKNFTKYWTSAGLHSEQPRRMNDAAPEQDSVLEGLPPEGPSVRDKAIVATGRKTDMLASKEEIVETSSINGFGSIQAEDFVPSSQGKIHIKSSQLKNKKQKRQGVKRHKNDCLCAICIMKRRKRERLKMAQVIRTSDGNQSQDFKQEGTFLIESPGDDDTSSNMDNSLDPEADADLIEKGEEVKSEAAEQQYSSQLENQENESENEIRKNGEGETSEQSQLGDRTGEDPNSQTPTQIAESGAIPKKKEEKSVQNEEEAAAAEQHKRKMDEKTKMYKEFLQAENPMLLELCGTLFPNNRSSAWSRPHSLVQHPGSERGSSVHSAIATLMMK